MKIKLNSANDVALFVSKCNEFPEEIDVKRGRHSVDGKSMMGVLALATGKICEVYIHTDNKRVIDSFKQNIMLWEADENA